MAEKDDKFPEMYHTNGGEQDRNYDYAQSNPRVGILALLDDFLCQILSIRKTLSTVFVSSILLAPLSMALSIYIFTHPSFDRVLNAQDNFGEILEVLLVAILGVSSIWLVIGIKQYKTIGSWNKEYSKYLKDQAKLEHKIMLKYGISNDEDDSSV